MEMREGAQQEGGGREESRGAKGHRSACHNEDSSSSSGVGQEFSFSCALALKVAGRVPPHFLLASRTRVSVCRVVYPNQQSFLGQ